MLLGWISDKFGRRKPLYFTVCLAAVFGFAGAFSPLFWLFVSARFVVGFMLGMSSVIVTEMMIMMIGYKQRAFPTSFPRLSHAHRARREREPWKRSFAFFLQYSLTVQYTSNPPVGKPVTMELHWRLHGRPVRQNHSHPV